MSTIWKFFDFVYDFLYPVKQYSLRYTGEIIETREVPTREMIVLDIPNSADMKIEYDPLNYTPCEINKNATKICRGEIDIFGDAHLYSRESREVIIDLIDTGILAIPGARISILGS